MKGRYSWRHRFQQKIEKVLDESLFVEPGGLGGGGEGQQCASDWGMGSGVPSGHSGTGGGEELLKRTIRANNPG